MIHRYKIHTAILSDSHGINFCMQSNQLYPFCFVCFQALFSSYLNNYYEQQKTMVFKNGQGMGSEHYTHQATVVQVYYKYNWETMMPRRQSEEFNRVLGNGSHFLKNQNSWQIQDHILLEELQKCVLNNMSTVYHRL